MRYQIDKTKYLNAIELSHLRHVASDGTRDSILIRTALATGARAQEILNITKSDLDDKHQSVYIYGLKNSNNREIPLSKDLYNALKALSLNSNDERVFPIGYQRLVAIWKHYRPSKKKFHSLRHTFAIELYQRTKDLRLVQIALGHRGIMNTMVYSEYLYNQKELRKLLVD